MRIRLAAARALIACLLLALAIPVSAQSASDRASIDFALERGRLLFGIDRAAWVATDDLLARAPDAQTHGVRGYIVERDGDGYAVTFFAGPEDAPVAFYRASVGNNRIRSAQVYPAASRPELSPDQRRLADARQAALSGTARRPCGQAPFNSAVIPPASWEGPVDVYLLTPQVNAGEYPIGGHFRVTVGPNGRVTSERAFTNSCLLIGGAPQGAVGLGVTHLLDPVPTEIHVFTAITSGLPVYVSTSDDRVWEVTRERIRLIGR